MISILMFASFMGFMFAMAYIGQRIVMQPEQETEEIELPNEFLTSNGYTLKRDQQ